MLGKAAVNTTMTNLVVTGEISGCFPGRVHRGMDCFPGVSFKKNSGVEFEVNMIGPFKFDVNSVPNYRNDKTDRLQTIPKEVIANILSYSTYPKFSSTNHSFAVQLQLVISIALPHTISQLSNVTQHDRCQNGSKKRHVTTKYGVICSGAIGPRRTPT
jgi:hypothetical protein